LYNLGVYLGACYRISHLEPENGHALAVDIKLFAGERKIRDQLLLDPDHVFGGLMKHFVDGYKHGVSLTNVESAE
jgi:hypothetical protein